MKYLKSFESIEVTKNWISELMNTCKDIMLELEDVGLKTEIRRSLLDKYVLIECEVNINNINRRLRVVLLEVKARLIDYMSSEGFELMDRSIEASKSRDIFSLSFINKSLDEDYIGHLRYLKRYKENVESEDFYK